MKLLRNQAEIDAYYLADPAHSRAAGIIWPALVEGRLDKLFETAFRPDASVRNELFRPSGALGSFAVKVRVAYLLGWIGRDFYDDLILVTKIRNRFAHHIEAKDFSDRAIDGWLRAINVYKLFPGLLERARTEVRKEGTVKNKVMVDVLEDALRDGMMGFRLCIDAMLSELERCADNMKKNLANLPGNWLVAEAKPQEDSGGQGG